MDLLGHREPIFASHRECVLHNQGEICFDLLTSYYVNPHHEKHSWIEWPLLPL